ncbi:MAG: TIGR03618 family F420-dependent PPOX class oxidoreductase [Chloroflexi bacterium]|jgi:PPOX class probable F420-dependent enzyme|nr:TIGR03618 family F420-dependent PPOX class oxidoreductase [Chloroflexota bacterium]
MQTTLPTPGHTTLTAEARAFLAAARFAVVATAGADGRPHQAVVWYRLDGDVVVLNSAEGRRWPADLRRDPHASVMVEDGYRYVLLEGDVEVEDDQAVAQADIAEMARRYHADDPEHAERLIADRFQRQRRITFRLRPTRVSQDL